MARDQGEQEKHKSWCMPAEGLKGHVATDGSLLGTAGKWGACGWPVQLDYDNEIGPCLGCTAQWRRTIRRAELTAFLCPLKTVIGPVKVHVDKQRREEIVSVSSQEREMLIEGSKCGKN